VYQVYLSGNRSINVRKSKMLKQKILFLCTGNSCRSQMAEGFMRHFHGNQFTVYSAGIETHGLNPLAVAVMAEIDIDISTHQSQHIDQFAEEKLDFVVTVCDHASENCPIFPGNIRTIHKEFPDPPKMAKTLNNSEDILNCYRRVRDLIKSYIETLPANLPN
jgi:arsenate reductase